MATLHCLVEMTPHVVATSLRATAFWSCVFIFEFSQTSSAPHIYFPCDSQSFQDRSLYDSSPQVLQHASLIQQFRMLQMLGLIPVLFFLVLR